MNQSFASNSVEAVLPAIAALNLENSGQTIGFIAASPDTNYPETVKTLGAELSLPLVGGTSLGNPFAALGEEFGTSLALFGRNGVRSAVVMSRPVGSGDGADIAGDLHRRAVEKLGAEPKLFVVFMPITADMFADHLINALYGAAGDVPVFGGMVSDDLKSDRSAVFGDGGCHADRIALVALGGDIDPVFALGQEVTVPSGYSPVITEAEGNVIRRVDDMPFGEYLGKSGIDAAAIEDYPVSIRVRGPGDAAAGGREVVVDVVKLEPDLSGVLSNSVRVGDVVSLCYLTGENIRNSTRVCVDRLRAGMEEKAAAGRRFSMILAVSCITRYYVVTRDSFNREASELRAALPEEPGKFGIFAFAEYCPLPDEAGCLRNATHGQTLVMCAL